MAAQLDRLQDLIVAITCIICGPWLILLSQTTAAIRAIAINTQKMETGETYKTIDILSFIYTAIGICMVIFGVVILVKVFA
ncbi:MAG: hypothetical protein M0Z52_12035 [Actinomycetota bacterium]|nr:hypothetical protein [Actinomycetota bacterium]